MSSKFHPVAPEVGACQYYSHPRMQSSVETLEGNQVKLSVVVDEAEFETDITAAFRKIAKEVRLPGFRPGKAPRAVLEARIGVAPAREQALRDGIPQYLARAVHEHNVDIIDTPAVDITSGEESGPVGFDATIAIRPRIMVPGYSGLRVELPAATPTDEEINSPIDAELRRNGSLTAVERPAVIGDYITVDLSAERDGEPVAGLNTEDWQYEIGKGWVADTFDQTLIGSEVDDHLTFTATPSGTEFEADFEVTVKKVEELVLPELTDAWVDENVGEFDTVDAWKSSISERLTTVRHNQLRQMAVDRTTQALADLVEEEAPESLVNQELQSRAQNFAMQLQAQGISIEQYCMMTGQDQSQLIESLKDASVRGVKIDLALRAVADAENIEVDGDDLEAEYNRIAIEVRQKPVAVRKAYEKNDAVADLSADLRKRKALDILLDRVEIVDPEGHPIDRAIVFPGQGGEEAETE
jgi:trigger factor